MHSEDKHLLKHSVLIFLSTFIGGLVLFAANILLAKRFGPQEFGNFKTVINLFCFLPALIELGISPTLVKFISEFSDKRVNVLVKWLLKFRAVIYLMLIVICIILRDNLSIYFLKDVSQRYLMTAGIILFAFIFLDVFKFIVQGLENFRLYAISQFLTLGSAGIFTVFFGYNFGVFFAIIGWGLGYLVGNSINIIFVVRNGILDKTDHKIDVRKLLLNYGFPMHLIAIPGLLGLAVVPILSPFFSRQLIGYLAFSMIFYQGVISIPMAFSTVLFPKFSRLSKEPHKAKLSLEKALLAYLPIAVLGILGCLLLARPFIEFVSPQYLPSLLLFKMLVCFGLASGLFLIYSAYLSGINRLRKLAVLTFIQNLFLIIMSLCILKYIASYNK